MFTRPRSVIASESKRSGSNSKFYAEDIRKKPVNLLDKFGISHKKPERGTFVEQKENQAPRNSHQESFNLDLQLNSIINRVNTAINRSPARGNSPKPNPSPQKLQSSQSHIPIAGHWSSTFSFADCQSMSMRPPADQRLDDDRCRGQIVTETRRSALGIVDVNSGGNFERKMGVVERDLDREAARREVQDKNERSKLRDAHHQQLSQHKQETKTDKKDPFEELRLKIESEMKEIRRQVSSQGSTNNTENRDQNHETKIIEKIDRPANQLGSTSMTSSLVSCSDFHQAKRSSEASLDTRKKVCQDDSFLEVKLEELCARLKYVRKKEFNSLNFLLNFFKESFIANTEARKLIASVGLLAEIALEKLEKVYSKGCLMMQQSDCDSPYEDLVIQAMIQALKNSAQELLLSLRGSSEISTVTSDQSSMDMYRRESPIKRSAGKRSKTPTMTEDSFFDQNNLSLKKTPPMQKRSSKMHQQMAQVKERLQDSPQNTERGFIRLDEQNFGFKIHSLASYNRKVLVGFEDGAITEIIFDKVSGIKLVRCMRFRSEAVTDMLVVESNDVVSNHTLVAASGLTNPVLVVVNLQTGNQLLELTGHTQFISKLIKIADNCIASCSFDGSLRIWDIKSGSCNFNKAIHESPLITATYSPSLSLIATGDLGSCIVLSSVTLYSGGSFKSCEPYIKFQGTGPILEIFFDPFQKIVTFEGSKMRVYDCRGTLFKDLRNPHFVSSAYFIDTQTILLTDISGRPNLIDYEHALLDTSLTRPMASDRDSDEVELASLMVSNRVTGSLPRAQFLRLADGSQQVYSAQTSCKSLLLHAIN